MTSMKTSTSANCRVSWYRLLSVQQLYIHTENKLSSDTPGYILIGHKYQCYIKPTVIFVLVLWQLKMSLLFRKGRKWEWGDLLKLLRYHTLPSGEGGYIGKVY